MTMQITIQEVAPVIKQMVFEAEKVKGWNDPKFTKEDVEKAFLSRWGITYEKALEQGNENITKLRSLIDQSKARR